MSVLKLNLNFALTILLKYQYFPDSKTTCLLCCAPTLYINLLVTPARSRILGEQICKQKSYSVSTFQFPLALIIM